MVTVRNLLRLIVSFMIFLSLQPASTQRAFMRTLETSNSELTRRSVVLGQQMKMIPFLYLVLDVLQSAYTTFMKKRSTRGQPRFILDDIVSQQVVPTEAVKKAETVLKRNVGNQASTSISSLVRDVLPIASESTAKSELNAREELVERIDPYGPHMNMAVYMRLVERTNELKKQLAAYRNLKNHSDTEIQRLQELVNTLYEENEELKSIAEYQHIANAHANVRRATPQPERSLRNIHRPNPFQNVTQSSRQVVNALNRVQASLRPLVNNAATIQMPRTVNAATMRRMQNIQKRLDVIGRMRD